MNDNLRWRKSSYSGQGANCVEVADLPDGGMAVRDTKDHDGAMLRFSAEAWREFTSAIKDGRIG